MPSRRLPLAALVPAVLLGLVVGLPGVGTLPAQADPTGPADPAAPVATEAASPREVAEQALATVEELLEDGPVGGTTAPVDVDGRDLTMALRDLATTRADLPRGLRDDAARILARPTGAAGGCDPYSCFTAAVQKTCTDDICVHYVAQKGNPDRVPGENDGPGGAWPGTRKGPKDYAEFVLATVDAIAARYRAAGYRSPVSDGGAEGTPQFDVYLADVGGRGFYGYCTTDTEVTGHVPAPAYCVLDNDYAEFGINPKKALRATAAHEFFHAVQFAYDVGEDTWLLEATATWVEDEVFDAINDNRQYLPYGPLGSPELSLDTNNGISEYGAWIFFRHLSERFAATQGGLPTIVRDIWRRTAHDGGTGAAGMYSMQAVAATLASRGSSLPLQFAKFSIWNGQTTRYYDEGAAYRSTSPRRTWRLRPGSLRRSTSFRLNHLATATHRFSKGSGMSGSWRLRLRVDMMARSIGAKAYVTVKKKGRAPRTRFLALNADGNIVVERPFGARVEWVEVTTVNASTRYAGCNDPDRGPEATCQGFPLDDGALQTVKGRAVRTR